MRRSFIDDRIEAMLALCDRHGFKLPSFAHWDEARYRREAASVRHIRDAGLGWNVVEFKPGAFRKRGLTLFTLRMGDWRSLASGAGRLYAEKAMMAEDGQVTPHHFHIVKTEDILNRGGARFVVELFKVDAEGTRRDERFKIQKDAETLDLAPGAQMQDWLYVGDAASGLLRLGELALAAGIPPGVLNVIAGDGATSGKVTAVSDEPEAIREGLRAYVHLIGAEVEAHSQFMFAQDEIE